MPGGPSAEFVCAMEDVLDLYTRPYDPRHPTVWLDETSKQRVGEVQAPLPVAPGKPARFDSQYVRNGVANLFMLVEPMTGRCQVKVTERRTKRDWAFMLKDLVDHHYRKADTITLVVDNLNTHQEAAFYEVFPPEEAKRIADKIDIHFTPKRGSCLPAAGRAQHRRNRSKRPLPSVSGSTHLYHRTTQQRSERLAHGTESESTHRQLALHDC